jgi:Uma2 family endonuclease
MVQAPAQRMILDDFLGLPEVKPANEFINGAICQKPMPQGKHSIIQRELTFAIDRPLRDRKIARAFPELRCTFGQRSPDEETVFVYQSQKEVEIFDEADQILLMPAFATELNLSVGELFGWLTE